MTNIHFYSPKGGTGTSTTVVAMAGMLSDWGANVLIVEHSDSACEIDAVICTARNSEKMIQEVKKGISLSWNYSPVSHYGYDFILFDHGHKIPKKGFPVASNDKTIAVLRNDYLSLRAMATLGLSYEDSILIVHPEGALQVQDVRAVMQGEVLFTVPFSPAIARGVDAGLLLSRLSLKEYDQMRDFCHKMVHPQKAAV